MQEIEAFRMDMALTERERPSGVAVGKINFGPLRDLVEKAKRLGWISAKPPEKHYLKPPPGKTDGKQGIGRPRKRSIRKGYVLTAKQKTILYGS